MLGRLRVIAAVLLVALPLQGLAVSARALCDHTHGALDSPERALEAPAAAHHHADGATGQHDDPTSSQGDHVGHAFIGERATLPVDTGAAEPAAFESGSESCAHCAACCVGGAIVGSPLRLAALPRVQPDFIVARIAVRSPALDGPDRPPRII